MAVMKYSRQRESIREFLSSRKDHPSAETIYSHVKLVYPRISLGTVYRNLSLLADLGEITRLGSIGGAERFDARTEPHSHFICKACGKVEDFDDLPVRSLLEAASRNFQGEITDFRVKFYGLCKDCRAQQKIKSEDTQKNMGSENLLKHMQSGEHTT